MMARASGERTAPATIVIRGTIKSERKARRMAAEFDGCLWRDRLAWRWVSMLLLASFMASGGPIPHIVERKVMSPTRQAFLLKER